METTSAGKTSSTCTTATKRRLKQEVRKNINICNTPPTSEDEQPQAPTIEEKQKLVLEKTLSVHAMQPLQPTHQEEGGQQQQKPTNPPQQGTTASGQGLKFMLKKRKQCIIETPSMLPKIQHKKALKKQLLAVINNLMRKQMTLLRTPLTKCLPLDIVMNQTLVMKYW